MPARPHTIATWLRYLGAAALFAVGVLHLQQFSAEDYSAIPTIGTLFALNFASATLVAAGLAAPARILRGRGRWGPAAALSVSGIGIAAGSLAGLFISERTALFGFHETGYRPAIVLSIGLEVATIALLTAHLAALPRRPGPQAAPGGAAA